MNYKTYTTSASTTTAVAATATSTTTSRRATAGTLSTSSLTLGLLTSRLRLAGELNGDLALQDLLARQLLDGTLGLTRCREVDEGVTNGTVGAGVLGN